MNPPQQLLRRARIITLMRLGLAAVTVLLAGESGQAEPVRSEPIRPELTVRVSNRSELIGALRQAQPGTRIRLAPGVYAGGIVITDLRGTKAAPIVIESEFRERRAVIDGGNSGIQLSNAAHVELRQLEIRKSAINGLNLDDGGERNSTANGITLADLWIHDIGSRGNHDGIKLSGIDDFVVQRCKVERWGQGGSGIDMVGCHRGKVLESQFRNPQAHSASGVQAKGGSQQILIQSCRFDEAGGRAVNLGGSTGLNYFRPPDAAYEARQITVENCTFVGSMAPIAFVGVDGAIVRFNTIYRPTRWVVRILQENQSDRFIRCRNGRFESNLVVFDSTQLRTAVNVGEQTEPQSFRFADNAWYCLDRPTETRRLVRLPVPETGGTYGVAPRFANAAEGDFRQLEGSRIRAGAGLRSADR